MSEEAKSVYIQMRMKEIKRMKRISDIGMWVGVLLIFVGFVFDAFGFLAIDGFWFWVRVAGIFIASFELYSYALNSYQYFILKQESKTLTEDSQSP